MTRATSAHGGRVTTVTQNATAPGTAMISAAKVEINKAAVMSAAFSSEQATRSHPGSAMTMPNGASIRMRDVTAIPNRASAAALESRAAAPATDGTSTAIANRAVVEAAMTAGARIADRSRAA